MLQRQRVLVEVCAAGGRRGVVAGEGGAVGALAGRGTTAAGDAGRLRRARTRSGCQSGGWQQQGRSSWWGRWWRRWLARPAGALTVGLVAELTGELEHPPASGSADRTRPPLCACPFSAASSPPSSPPQPRPPPQSTKTEPRRESHPLRAHE
ncbi:hypothetical protein BRADI_3g12699v3 [Brachypodium distachyon]|uniref:Uncharacterized protein n=1 Tax=Brachypodium distachyon TaxID=15368 RepID=A0A2K2CWR7_BRADI|nr:hypothetical protein BRADI_3g12699v3 [Brachypodium distachyon]